MSVYVYGSGVSVLPLYVRPYRCSRPINVYVNMCVSSDRTDGYVSVYVYV